MIGFEALNQHSSVTISSNSKPLCYAFRGRVAISNSKVVDRPAVGSIVFASPVYDPSPPRLFVRLAASRHGSLEIYVVINGRAGAWTGFTIYAAAQGGKTLPLYELDYVVARPSFKEPSSDWALQLLDGAGKTVFCSDEMIVRFSKFTKKWTLGSASTNWLYYNTLYSGVNIEQDDYVDVTFFNRGLVVQFAKGLMYTGVQLYSSGVRVFNLQAQCSNSLTRSVGISSINFCTPICKFPIDRYPA